jgi:hypothetical protein
MGTETVVDILAGLRLVSNRALPLAAQLPGQPKCDMSSFSLMHQAFS